MRSTILCLTLLLGFATGACGGLIGDSHQLDTLDDDGDLDDDLPGGCDPVITLARGGCTQSGCHGATFQGNLDLVSIGVEERLINVRSRTAACSGQLLVDPIDWASSLILKATNPDAVAAGGVCTQLMPLDHAPLSDEDRACLAKWVSEMVSDWNPAPTEVFEPAQPETYAAKVKALLTGEALVSADLVEVNEDPVNLRTLVSDWTETAGFRTAFADFFSNTLQARVDRARLVELFGPRGSIIVRANGAKLVPQLEESVTTTALDIVATGKPFTEVVTTRRWWVNSAILSTIAFFDLTMADRTATARRHTVQRGTTALPLATSISTKTWVFPQQPADCNITKLTDLDLLGTFFGTLRCNPTINLTDPAFAPTDFTDWRYVELVSGTPTAEWYDLPKIRGVTRFAVRNPRAGFFNQIAFLSNWQTNVDNKYRVTINQTLIAALDATFSAADPTDGLLPSQIDTEHAAPGTQCYGCHRLMDPMRGYFASTEDTAYAYQDESTPAAFAFFGQRRSGGTVDTFATTIATHPRFAMAWTQKLCMYATAHRCDESDPEVIRIADAFKTSGFDFKTLVIELFTSPLVTEAEEVQTFETVEPYVSITRRNHLCTMLEQRTQVASICAKSTVVAALNLLPDDNYARGETDLVQATQTGPFHQAAAAKLCNAVAPLAVTTTSPLYPSRATDIANAIVEKFMGLPVGHSRHDAAVGALNEHIAAAKVAGASVDNASRSAFIAACMSSDFLALGM